MKRPQSRLPLCNECVPNDWADAGSEFIVGGGEEYGTMVKTAKAASMSSTSDVRSEVQPPGTCDRHSPSN